ncbi:hypothetical protein [Rossellomorea aquimaris]|uniref:Uncharacterized protein n=2 Tax=Rossellomorea TaxID=2837508 RepID=A0A366EKS0_9BACI|nr:hypothetical protein [Rossellomorea aquimaris]RBP02983.1 hypothetical protein DET59_11180 [Rossellomorea aquimaris]
MMWWFVILITGTLLFALLIDIRRKKRGNDRHVQGIHPDAKPGEDRNYTMGGGRDSGGGTGN